MRVIVPGQPQDRSGLDAMIEMTEGLRQPGDARLRHFIVPLPPGMSDSSPELLGFWTYELQIGHKAIWSTAQVRFGRPLVVKGVQHPAPALSCAAFRGQANPNAPLQIVVTAPFATAVFKDQRLTNVRAGDPCTRIWALLYAQVTQADGASRRNVLIGRTPAVPMLERGGSVPVPATRDVLGVARLDAATVEHAFAELALPPDAPLSVIVVELLPGDHLVQTERVIGERPGVTSTQPSLDKVFVVFDRPDGVSITAGDVPRSAMFVGPPADDPLGRDLGTIASRRILRCSTLTPVAPAC